MSAMAARKQFGMRGTAVSRPETADVPALKRSHVVALAAIGFVAVAGGIGASLMRTPADMPAAQAADSLAALDAKPTTEGQQTQQRTGGSLVVVPVIIPGSMPPAAAPAQARPAAPSPVERGGFGETAKAHGASGGSSAVAS
jgi:hypothetical protein